MEHRDAERRIARVVWSARRRGQGLETRLRRRTAQCHARDLPPGRHAAVHPQLGSGRRIIAESPAARTRGGHAGLELTPADRRDCCLSRHSPALAAAGLATPAVALAAARTGARQRVNQAVFADRAVWYAAGCHRRRTARRDVLSRGRVDGSADPAAGRYFTADLITPT